MKTVFYFMITFVALIFLFGGVLSHDNINLNQELHGMAVKSIENTQNLEDTEYVDPIQEAESNPDLIVVYPYEE